MATQVTVTGTLVDAEGVGLGGTISFRPSQPLYDTSGNLIVGTAPVSATITSGALSVVLYATDDTNTSPDNATYTITENLTGADGNPIKRKYKAEIPSASATLRYEDISEAVPATQAGTSYATLAYVQSLLSSVVLPDDSATNAKLANMAASTIKGRRGASGTGSPEDLTPTQLKAIIESAPLPPTVLAAHAKIATALTSTVDIVYVGDSLFEVDAWGMTQVKRQAQQYLGLGDIEPSKYVHPNPTVAGTGWTSYSGTAATTYGLGGQSYSLAVGQAASHTFTGDACELVYTTRTSNGGSIVVDIDGSTVTTLNTTDAGVSGFQSGIRWSSGFLGWGRHTITITGSGSGSSIYDGLMEHRGTLTKGIRWWNAGHTGWDTGDFAPATHTGTYDAIDEIDPDAVVVCIGTNDYSDGISTFTTRLDTMLDAIESAAPDAAIVLVGPHASSNRSAGNWSAFVEQIRVEAASRGAAFVDVYEAVGDVGSTYDTYNLSADGVHPNDNFANIIGALIGDRLLPRSLALTDVTAPTVSRVYRPEGFFRHIEDFVNTDATTGTPHGWIETTSGTGATITQVGILYEGCGICRLDTGTVATGYAALNGAYMNVPRLGMGDMSWRLRTPTITAAGNTFATAVGLVGGVFAAGWWFGHDAGDTNWQLYTANGTTTTKTDSGIAIDGDWHWFRLLRSGTAAYLYIDGTVACGTTSTLPTTSGVLTPQAWLVKYTGTSQRYMDVDCMVIEHDVTR